MNNGIYTITSGGIAALARLDAVTQNLANVNTAGYKQAVLVFSEKPVGASVGGDPVLGGTTRHVREVESIVDFSQGPIHDTGNPLDVAIDGKGFFVVSTPAGERYTRQGTFDLDGDGRLVTHAGNPVQGEDGDIIVPPGKSNFRIGEDGTVSVDREQIGRLRLVDFGDDPKLVPEGGALFSAAPGAVATPLGPENVRLHPQAFEGSNANAVTGMIELVEVNRAYESYMRAMQRLDDLQSRAINEVGRVG
jgi:flagellar basal-body rod protein FlgF